MRFKVFCTLIIGLFLIIPAMLFAQNESASARINYTEGTVGLNLEQAEIDMLISERDELSTQKGRVEVVLNDRDFLRLNYHTQVVFDVLQERLVRLDIRYGEVYIQTENPIEIKTPHENFLVEDVSRIEVDRYETKKYHNLRLIDDFDKWTYRRQEELSHPVVADYREDYREYYDQYYFSPYWYYSWYPYYWTGWYSWYPVWFYYNYYPYYYGYYQYNRYYYDDSYYGSTINKNQLQKKNSNSSVNSSGTTNRDYPSRISKSSISKSPSVKSSSRIISSPPRSTLSKSSISRSSRISAPSASRYLRSFPPRSSSGSVSRGAIRKK